jgi:hypothetical protein
MGGNEEKNKKKIELNLIKGCGKKRAIDDEESRKEEWVERLRIRNSGELLREFQKNSEVEIVTSEAWTDELLNC